MMKRQYILQIILLLACLSVSARQIDKATAMQKTSAYLMAHGVNEKIIEPVENPKTKKIAKKFTTSGSNQSLYVFNIDNGGFVIASGDDAFPAVLCYSMNRIFKCETMPEEVITFMQVYSEQIKNFQKSGKLTVAPLSQHVSIKPLLTTEWGQDTPYNSSCPDFFDKGKPLTGCAAVAMSQLLYYYHTDTLSVSATTAEIPAYSGQIDWSGNGPVEVEAIPAGSPIDWKNMLANYPEPKKGVESKITDAQKKAVADLMFYCAASVKTSFANYHNGGSIATLYDVPDAMKKYFGFSRSAKFVKRSHYKSQAEWDSVIYAELAAKRPVMMQCQNNIGGHVFIVDGFQNGYYHVHWGWNGGANGYYLMTALTDAQNKYDMEAIIGAVPDDKTFTETPVLLIKDFTVATKTVDHYDNGYPCDYVINATSHMANAYTFDIAIGVFNEQGELVKTSSILSTAKDVTSTITASVGGTAALNVQPGNYTICPVCRVQGTEQWIKCEGTTFSMQAGSNSASFSN